MLRISNHESVSGYATPVTSKRALKSLQKIKEARQRSSSPNGIHADCVSSSSIAVP